MALVRIIPGKSINEWNGNSADLFNQFFGSDDANNVASEKTWTPRVDVAESDENYQLVLELPGLQQKDIKIHFEDDVLTVEGERPKNAVEGQRLLRSENHYGKFSRSFRLNNRIAADNISANYREGLLTIFLPKAEEAKPREIKISANSRSKK